MKIANIVATIKLKAPLDLSYLTTVLDGAVKDPKVHWLKYRLQPENQYIAFYKSGKILISAKSFEKLEEIKDRILAQLSHHSIRTEEYCLNIHNIVVLEQFNRPVILEKLIANLDAYKSSYEPEQFPALIYKNWGVTFLLFSSGKVIMTGAKNEKDVIENLDKLRCLLDRTAQ